MGLGPMSMILSTWPTSTGFENLLKFGQDDNMFENFKYYVRMRKNRNHFNGYPMYHIIR